VGLAELDLFDDGFGEDGHGYCSFELQGSESIERDESIAAPCAGYPLYGVQSERELCLLSKGEEHAN
jgi:hypothetical protein